MALRRATLSADRAQRGRRQAAGGVRHGARPLRRHDPGLLRPRRADQGHGHRRRPRRAVPSRRSRDSAAACSSAPEDKELALACVRGLERLPARRMVRHGARTGSFRWRSCPPGIPCGLPPRIQRLARQGHQGDVLSRQPRPAGPAVVPRPSTGTGALGRLEAADMPVCLHFGSGGYVPGFSFAAGSYDPERAVRRGHRDVFDEPDVEHRRPGVLAVCCNDTRT